MKKILKFLFSVATTAVVAILLLSGCQNRKKKECPKTPVQDVAVVDTTTQEDTMKAFYERMRRWKALHGYTDRWESDK